MDLSTLTPTDILLIALLWVNLANFFLLYFNRGKRSKIIEQKVPINETTTDGSVDVPILTQKKSKRFQFRRSKKPSTVDPFYLNKEYLKKEEQKRT